MNIQIPRKGMSMWQRLLVMCALAFGGWVQAQTSIESVSASVQGGAEVVRIDLSQTLTFPPAGFVIQSPARIALDFPGTTNGLGRSTVEINQGNLKSVSVVQAADRTRVVVNLKQPATYKTEIQGKSLLITVEQSTVSAAVATSEFSEERKRDVSPLKDLDFRKTSEGAGRIVVALTNNQVSADIRQQGQYLVVEFMKSSLPEGLRRRLDVSDFGTPIKTVSTTQVGDRVRMVIEPKGQWEHSAYQTDEQFVVEVKEIKVDPQKLTQGLGYNGQKLSLNFQNIEVRSLLQVVADFTNFNIVTSDSVTGSVTLRLQDVPWDQALDIILQAKGLDMRKNGNVIWVAPKDEIASKEKLDLESAVSVQSLEPLRTQSFQINYAKAADIAGQLAATGTGASVSARILSSRGSAIAEPRTNQLFVTDIPTKLEQVQQLLAKLDIAVRQVMIEARIVEASDTFGKQLGVRLGGADLRAQAGAQPGYQLPGDNRAVIGTNYANVIGSSGAGAAAVSAAGTFVNLPAPSADAGTFAVSIFSAAAQRFLNLEISALEQDGKGKVVSSPRLVTSDQQKATIQSGKKLPFQKATSSGATSVEFAEATLKLEVTPQITPEGSILMNLKVSKNSTGLLTPGVGYSIEVKEIETQVLVENGGTVVIGGVYTEEQINAVDKVPFFGDLPFVGVMFRRAVSKSDKQELLVFITPRVLGDRGAIK